MGLKAIRKMDKLRLSEDKFFYLAPDIAPKEGLGVAAPNAFLITLTAEIPRSGCVLNPLWCTQIILLSVIAIGRS